MDEILGVYSTEKKAKEVYDLLFADFGNVVGATYVIIKRELE
jgi:hypothetical protein